MSAPPLPPTGDNFPVFIGGASSAEAEAEAALPMHAARWNRHYAVGTPVAVEVAGNTLYTFTESSAWRSSTGADVVRVKGLSGVQLLTAVRAHQGLPLRPPLRNSPAEAGP